MEKLTLLEARKEAHQIVKNGIDLEVGETKRDWIETYLEALRDDGIITRKFKRTADDKIFTLEDMLEEYNLRHKFVQETYYNSNFEDWLKERVTKKRTFLDNRVAFVELD